MATGQIKPWGKRMAIKQIQRDFQSQYVTDENGQQITFEEYEFRQKYIPYKQY